MGFILRIIAAALFSFSVYAASVIPMTLNEMVTSADTIVVARCTEIKSYWQDNKIVTDNLLDVQKTIKGESIAQYIVTTLGGTAMHPRLKAPVNMAIPGGASFLAGEEVLLFTRRNERGINQIVGFTQGKLIIETDAATGQKQISVGQKVVTNQPGAADELDFLFAPFFAAKPHEARIRIRKIELSEMLEKIQAELAPL